MLLLSRTGAAQRLRSRLRYVPGQDLTLARPPVPVVTIDSADPAVVGKFTISTACRLVFHPARANRHVLGMENPSGELTGTITVMFTGNATGSVAELELPYRGVITGAYAARGYADAKYQVNGNLIPPAATFSAWMVATGTGWYFDSGAEKLYVRMVLPASNSGTLAYQRGGMFTGAPVYFRFSG